MKGLSADDHRVLNEFAEGRFWFATRRVRQAVGQALAEVSDLRMRLGRSMMDGRKCVEDRDIARRQYAEAQTALARSVEEAATLRARLEKAEADCSALVSQQGEVAGKDKAIVRLEEQVAQLDQWFTQEQRKADEHAVANNRLKAEKSHLVEVNRQLQAENARLAGERDRERMKLAEVRRLVAAEAK